jgi:hypothetical protein
MLSFKQFLNELYIDLKHSDLTKRGGARTQVFVQKVKDGEPFLTKKGAVVLDRGHLDDIEKGMEKRGYRDIFTGTDTKNKRPVRVNYSKEFLKTPEFGGKGAGAGTAAEDAYLKNFTKVLEKVFATENQPIINLQINGRTVECAGIISTPQRGRRAPKSDFSIVNATGEEVAWLSHKAGTKPSQFQQYGGLSDSAFSENPDVKQFVMDLKKLYPNGLERGNSAYRPCKDVSIINMSVYGTAFGGEPAAENVDEFHQGTLKLKKLPGNATYEIISSHKGSNGSILDSGGYEPIYYARYTGDRGARVAGEFIENARIGVFPAAKAAKTSKLI